MSEAEPRLVVYGAGGHGKVVTDALLVAGTPSEGFVDDEAAGSLGGRAWLMTHRDRMVVVAIGDNAARARVQTEILAAGISIATCIHPSAVVAASARVGTGAQILALAVLNPDARVGVGVIVNTGAVIEHDCQVGEFAHISPNATLGGEVHVGARSHVGIGATILPGIVIGDDAVVGAGAVVTRDVPDGAVVLGVPARPR